MTGRPTKSQKDTLMRLGRMSGEAGHWIYDKSCGGPASLEHLFDKGLVEFESRRGPRGGYHYYYRPNAAGWAIINRAVMKARSVADREMTLDGIDTALIEARKAGKIVLVYSGPTLYYRGVPGEVERVEDWDKMTSTVVLNIGQRQIPLRSITKVEAA
jgi:hypothetical protein